MKREETQAMVAVSTDAERHASPEKEERERIFMCITLETFSPRMRVGILTVGIVVFYLAYFLITEVVFRDKSFQFGGFVIFMENLSFAILAFAESGFKLPPAKSPMSSLSGLGVASMVGACTSLYSLQFLPFPTWVLFKSCRPISVMIGGIIILQKSYGIAEYLAVFLMTGGLACFSLGDYEAKPADTSVFGLTLVIISLLGNAFHSTFQEKYLRVYKPASLELIFYPSVTVCVLLIPWLTAIGEMQAAIAYMMEHPRVLGLSLMQAPLAYLGLNLVVGLMRLTSALNVQIVTSLRKAMTIIFSFLLFSQPFTMKYIYGGMIVFVGLSLHVWAEDRAAHRKNLPAATSLKI